MQSWTESGQEMAEEVRRQLQEIGWGDFYYFEETDSTNTQAKKLALKGAAHGSLVLANQQTAGKGRRGRMWESPRDSGIFMTFLLRPQIEMEKISMLTLVAALAISKAVEEVCGCEWNCQIKWPNDLVMNRKKICGILTEMGTEGSKLQYVVVGIGINVAQQQFPEELKETATSLCQQTQRPIVRAKLVEAAVRAFRQFYEQWEKQGDLSLLRKEYEAKLVNRNREVLVLDPKGNYTGTALGITDTGELLVCTKEGETCEVRSGEVSVRGIYGYV